MNYKIKGKIERCTRKEMHNTRNLKNEVSVRPTKTDKTRGQEMPMNAASSVPAWVFLGSKIYAVEWH